MFDLPKTTGPSKSFTSSEYLTVRPDYLDNTPGVRCPFTKGLDGQNDSSSLSDTGETIHLMS